MKPINDSITSTKTSIRSVCPYLPSDDVIEGARFYTERLGFEIAHQEGNGFVLLRRDGVEIALTKKDAAFTPGGCMIHVAGIERIYDDCLSSGTEIESPLSEKPWGMKMFIAKDRDGNLLDFGESVA